MELCERFLQILSHPEAHAQADVTGNRNILSHVSIIESIENLRRSAHGVGEISEEESQDFAGEVMECANCAIALNSVFPNLDLDNLANVLRTVEEQSIMTRLTNLECQGNRINPGIPNREQVGISESFRDAHPKIDRHLSANNPVYLSYHSTVIQKGNQLRRHDLAGVFDGHALIIGRRFNQSTNKCEYLIRNSYGSELHKLPPIT